MRNKKTQNWVTKNLNEFNKDNFLPDQQYDIPLQDNLILLKTFSMAE